MTDHFMDDVFQQFLVSAGAAGRLMGLDVGDRTIGIALSDNRRKISTPMQTIRRKKFSQDAEVLRKLIEEHEVKGLVIGLPLHTDGTEGKRCQSTRQFARNLLKLFTVPVYFQDERFSTSIVEEVLHAAEMNYRKRAEVVDKMAAGYILQSALDKIQEGETLA